MKRIYSTIFLFGLLCKIGFSQEVVNTIEYHIFIETANGIQTEVESGTFNEESSLVLTEKVLNGDLAIYQSLYDAIVGSELGLESGALDSNIILNITLKNLAEDGKYKLTISENLFLFFEIDVIVGSHWYAGDEHFYFKNNKSAYLNIPITPAFIQFCTLSGIDINQGVSFGYLTKDQNGNEFWDISGLSWQKQENEINVSLIHFSKFAGGGRTLGNTTNVDIDKNFPDEFNLLQNYPNPFNPSTVIKFNLPENGNVNLKVYSSLGNEISTLISEYKNSGEYSINFDGSQLSTGVYFYTLNLDGKVQTRKMLLIK